MDNTNSEQTILDIQNEIKRLKPRLDIQTEIKGLENLDKYIDYIKRFATSKFDKKFQKFIRNKVLKTAEIVSNNLLAGGTTNDDAIDLYKANHKIRKFDGGFILYNDTKIPAIVKGKQNTIENYPDGMFNVALAFEYGVGIVGSNTPTQSGSWEYNVQGYNFGWYLPREATGEIGVLTGGYMGFEIYRNIAIEVQNNLQKWVNEYFKTR